jgi:hypothetical protein
MTVERSELRVAVGAETDTDTEELAQLASRLRGALLDLDVDADNGDSLELTGISSATQDRLVELWVMRHDGAG